MQVRSLSLALLATGMWVDGDEHGADNIRLTFQDRLMAGHPALTRTTKVRPLLLDLKLP